MLEKFESTLLSGKNIFLTGAGGTGKTFLLQKMIEKYPANFVVTSSTGISAIALFEGARTIHSFSTIGLAKNEDFKTSKELVLFFKHMKFSSENSIKNTRHLIIEEVSMISASQLDLIDRVFRLVRKKNKPFGGIQIIFSGDFLQLPPVSKEGEYAEYAFQARSWKEAEPEIIYLNEVKRTENKEFAELCLRLRTINYTVEDYKLLKSLEDKKLENPPVILFSTNKKADEENTKQLNLLATPMETFKGKYKGPKNDFKDIREGLLCPHELLLKSGCRVMITANQRQYEHQADETLEYVNGSMGTYLSSYIDETKKEFKQVKRNEETNEIIYDSIGKVTFVFDRARFPVLVIKLDNGTVIDLKRMSWTQGERVYNKDTGREEFEIEYKQFPVRLAWGVTIHKAQGLSLDSLEIDCDRIFTDSQFYVALSRARSLEGLKIRNLKGKHIMASEEALNFYKNLELE